MMTKAIPHPSSFIDSQLADILRSLAAVAEQSGSLHPGQLSIIYEQKWFNLFVPHQYNGLQLSLPQALKMEEGLAWADGSVGWTVTLCSGANWFVGFLQPSIAKVIFNTGTVCLAGSGRPSGIARMFEGGYRISGYWSYASGAAHATAFTSNCVIEKDGVIMQDKDGNPIVQSFLFLREEVILHEDWNCTGLKATSSHSFEVQQLWVDENRRFLIGGNHTLVDHPVYQYPFLHFAEATLAVNSSGMAIRFLDLCESIFAKRMTNKNYPEEASDAVSNRLERARAELKEIRQSFYTVIQLSWNECLNKTVPLEILKVVSEKSKALAATARKLVDELYPYCGLTAANQDSEINRVWRNLHTASQHPLLLY